jgi:hypothetical protein
MILNKVNTACWPTPRAVVINVLQINKLAGGGKGGEGRGEGRKEMKEGEGKKEEGEKNTCTQQQRESFELQSL